MRSDLIKTILKEKPYLKSRLFLRGFYASTDNYDKTLYPFYGEWNEYKVDDMIFFVHPQQLFYTYTDGNNSIVMVGHAYDPIHMIVSEDDILKILIQGNERDFFEEICSLTGIYTIIWKKDGEWKLLGDASGMQTAFYTVNNGKIHISSHSNLIGDLLGLEIDPYIKRLSSYKFYKLMGDCLPGDLTQFSDIKRVVPNHYVRFNGSMKVVRFHTPEVKNISYNNVVDRVSTILHNSMKMISEKWDKPAISLTGGCDSKTTLACTNGLYDKFMCFSYVSSEEEKVDAEAAHRICKAVFNGDDSHHNIYTIPKDDSAFNDIEEQREILYYNCGSLRRNNNNDVRKRCFFARINDFDVEVKSWASEIGRAYYSKRFNRKKFPKQPNPRACTTIYKLFLHDRKLVRDTDNAFAEYLNKYSLNSKSIPWTEQFFWEFRTSSWQGLAITGEHRYSFDITIPYNNCELLELLLSVPLEDRISDKLYDDIRTKMNPIIDKTGVSVQNIRHTRNRALIENMYYIIHSHLPI